MKSQANIYEARFSKLAIQLRKSKNAAETNKILKEYLYSGFEDKFPKKDEFISAFFELKYSKSSKVSDPIAKYAVNKICCKFDECELFHQDSSVEHILNEDNSDKITMSIGNLICLEVGLNNRASNNKIADKFELYRSSRYSQVKKFLESYANYSENEFKSEGIKKRAKELAEFYYDKILLSNL